MYLFKSLVKSSFFFTFIWHYLFASKADCISLSLSSWALSSGDGLFGQSFLDGSITIDGRMFRHSTWALNSSISTCFTSLLLLNRYNSFDQKGELVSQLNTTQSGQDVWCKIPVMVQILSSTLRMWPSIEMLWEEWKQWSPKLWICVKDTMLKSIATLSLACRNSSARELFRLAATKAHLPWKRWTSGWCIGPIKSLQVRGAQWLTDTKQRTATSTANMSLCCVLSCC